MATISKRWNYQGLKNRNFWDKKWYEYVNQDIVKNNFSCSLINNFTHPYSLKKELKDILTNYPKELQPAGEVMQLNI